MAHSCTVAVLTSLLTVLPATGQTLPPEQVSWPVDIMQQFSVTPNVIYSTANNYECKLDVYSHRNTTSPAPTILHIHGGGWVGGTKESAILIILPYLEMGLAVVNVEYRLARTSLAPAAVEDCRLALRWVFENAKKYGFDTNRVVVTGGSAGGHLALMTGMLDPAAGFDAPKEWSQEIRGIHVAAIINWFGITDVNDLLSGTNRQTYAVSWLGSQSNREALAARVSPLTYVRKGLPPILTIHGDSDNVVPFSHAVRLHKSLGNAGVPNQLITIHGGKHGGFTRDEMLNCYAAIRKFLLLHRVLVQM